MIKAISQLIPGRAQKSIEDNHRKIVNLIRQKRDLLLNPGMHVNYFVGPTKEEQIQIIDEEIKESEEIIKLYTGRLDPNRKKWFWSILVPVFVSIFTTIVVTYIIKMYL